MPGGRRSCPPLASFHLVLGPWLRGWGGESRVRGRGAAERAWPVVRAGEPLYPHRWAFLSIPAQWPRTDCPPGRLSLDGLLSLPRATLTSPGQGKDTLPSLGELAATG